MKGKILITFFQIVSQYVGGCISPPWPPGYAKIARKFDAINLNFVSIAAAACAVKTDWYMKLLFMTMGPIGLICLIWVCFGLAEVKILGLAALKLGRKHTVEEGSAKCDEEVVEIPNPGAQTTEEECWLDHPVVLRQSGAPQVEEDSEADEPWNCGCLAGEADEPSLQAKRTSLAGGTRVEVLVYENENENDLVQSGTSPPAPPAKEDSDADEPSYYGSNCGGCLTSGNGVEVLIDENENKNDLVQPGTSPPAPSPDAENEPVAEEAAVDEVHSRRRSRSCDELGRLRDRELAEAEAEAEGPCPEEQVLVLKDLCAVATFAITYLCFPGTSLVIFRTFRQAPLMTLGLL